MTLELARIEAQREATRTGLTLAIVNEGPHADEFSELPSFGYCPKSAVAKLYKYGTLIETVKP
jgi:hypothetical protein